MSDAQAMGRRWHQSGWEGLRWSDQIDLPVQVLYHPEDDR